MDRVNWAPDGGTMSRFEYKYLVPPRVIADIREFMKPFVKPDSFADTIDDGIPTYTIGSLYLDSPDLRLYQQTLGGEKNRFKMRIRFYSDDPDSPVFLEVKKRESVVVFKMRAGVTREVAVALLAGNPDRSWLKGYPPKLAADVEAFLDYRTLTEAVPVCKIRYIREAYASKDNAPLRLTIDTDVVHAVTLEPELSLTKGSWAPTHFSGVIFEIKFTDRFPGWVRDLIQYFGLRSVSVPKYVESVDQARQSRGLRTASIGAFASSSRVFEDGAAFGSPAYHRRITRDR
jgi:hypothetical protein